MQVSVNIQGSNRSPRVGSLIPTLPVPYIGREYKSQYGYMATFQISAYDPDADDTVTFYLANSTKQGAVLANTIPEGTYPALWYRVCSPLCIATHCRLYSSLQTIM